MNQLTYERVVSDLALLSDPDEINREIGNQVLQSLIFGQQVWPIADQMLLNYQNKQESFFGAQLAYIALQRGLKYMEVAEIKRVKKFILGKLEDQQLQKISIGKLASCLATIVIILYPDEWPNFTEELTIFMQAKIHNFYSGLQILQRIPEELTKDFTQRKVRMTALNNFSERSELLVSIFLSALQLNVEQINKKIIMVLEQWAQVNFPFLQFTPLIGRVLSLIIENQKIGTCIIRIGTLSIIKNTLKQAYLSKTPQIKTTFNFFSGTYSKCQLESVGIIMKYLDDNRVSLFQILVHQQMDEDLQNIVGVYKQICSSYSFVLITEQGWEMIDFLEQMLRSYSLKVSHSSLSFWTWFFETALNDLYNQQEVQSDRLSVEILQIALAKVKLNEPYLRGEINENDETGNDDAMFLMEYRKDAQALLKSIHTYILRKSENGAKTFFDIIQPYLQHNLSAQQKAIGIELAIFVIQTCFGRGIDGQENPYETKTALALLTFILNDRVDRGDYLTDVVAEKVLTLIALYSFEVSEDQQDLYSKSLKYSMAYFQNEKICSVAIRAFESLMDKLKGQSKATCLEELVVFYLDHKFQSHSTQEIVIRQILYANYKNMHIERLMINVEKIMKHIDSGVITMQKFGESNEIEHFPCVFMATIKQIKAFATVYSNSIPGADQLFVALHAKLIEIGIVAINQTINFVIPRKDTIYNKKVFSDCSDLHNDLTECLELFRALAKLCPNIPVYQIYHQGIINMLDHVLPLFDINDLGPLLSEAPLVILASQIMKAFVGRQMESLNSWINKNLLHFNGFFSQYYGRFCFPNFRKADPDVLKAYFYIQEGLCWYCPQTFMQQPTVQHIFDLAVDCLRQILQKSLHQQVLAFIYRSMHIKELFAQKFSQVINAVFRLITLGELNCFYGISRILWFILKDLPLTQQQEILGRALEAINFDYIEEGMKGLWIKTFPIFLAKNEKTHMKGMVSHLWELKIGEYDGDYIFRFELIYGKWLSKCK